MRSKAVFVAVAVISAGIGAHSLNPRELYNEMYPVEALKRDAFHICNDANPTFIRAVKVDREACYDSMPEAIEQALGRVRPSSALAKSALLDPSRQAELLIELASIPPRQPITAPRSFTDTAWARSLTPCGPTGTHAAATPPSGAPSLPPSPGSSRTVNLGNLPPIPSPQRSGLTRPAVVTIPPAPSAASATPSTSADSSDTLPSFEPLPSPDIGDRGPPAIVPVQPGTCG
jgi:hypothetical protein